MSLFKYSFRVRPEEFASDHSAPRFPSPSPILLDALLLLLLPQDHENSSNIRARPFENKISHEGEGKRVGNWAIDWKFIHFFIHSY